MNVTDEKHAHDDSKTLTELIEENIVKSVSITAIGKLFGYDGS